MIMLVLILRADIGKHIANKTILNDKDGNDANDNEIIVMMMTLIIIIVIGKSRRRVLWNKQKCHNIGSRASGAAGDQNQSHRKGRLQLQEMGNAPSQERHDRELRGKSHRHRLGHRQNSLEITQRESHSHAQHDVS